MLLILVLIQTVAILPAYWPEFSWGKVNLHNKLGGDTAGTADPNQPKKWAIL